jgi:hypothetical protein
LIRVLGQPNSEARGREDNAAYEDQQIARLDRDRPKLGRFVPVGQVVKEPNSRRDHDQPVGKLVVVQRPVFGSACKPRMDHAVVCPLCPAGGTTQ